MRRLVTGLVILPLAVLGLVAGLDAVRSDDGPVTEPPGAETSVAIEGGTRAAAELRRARISGVLTFSDESCRLHALTLPELSPHPAPAGMGCRFTYSAGDRFSLGPAVSDGGSLTAWCRNGEVEVAMIGGRLLGRAPGCAPAWKPDGSLTFVRNGEVVWLRPPYGEPEQYERVFTLLSRRDLADAYRRGLGAQLRPCAAS